MRPWDLQSVFFIGEQTRRPIETEILRGYNRMANCMSMVTLTIAAAMFTQYWGPNFGIAPATFVLLIILVMMNVCGVRVGFCQSCGGIVSEDTSCTAI